MSNRKFGKKGNIFLLFIAISFLIASTFIFTTGIKLKAWKEKQELGLTTAMIEKSYYLDSFLRNYLKEVLPYRLFSLQLEFLNESKLTLKDDSCSNKIAYPTILSVSEKKQCFLNISKKFAEFVSQSIKDDFARDRFIFPETPIVVSIDKDNISLYFEKGLYYSFFSPIRMQKNDNGTVPIPNYNEISLEVFPYCTIQFNQPSQNIDNNKDGVGCNDPLFLEAVREEYENYVKNYGQELPELFDYNWLITIAKIESNCNPLVDALGAFQVIKYGREKFGGSTTNRKPQSFLDFKEQVKNNPRKIKEVIKEQTKYALETVREKTRNVRRYAQNKKIVLSPETELLLVINSYNIGENVIRLALNDFVERVAGENQEEIIPSYTDLVDSLYIGCHETYDDLYKSGKLNDNPCQRRAHNVEYVEKALKSYASLCKNLGGTIVGSPMSSTIKFYVHSNKTMKITSSLAKVFEVLSSKKFKEDVNSTNKDENKNFFTRLNELSSHYNLSVGFEEESKVEKYLYNYLTSLFYCLKSPASSCSCPYLNLNYVISQSKGNVKNFTIKFNESYFEFMIVTKNDEEKKFRIELNNVMNNLEYRTIDIDFIDGKIKVVFMDNISKEVKLKENTLFSFEKEKEGIYPTFIYLDKGEVRFYPDIYKRQSLNSGKSQTPPILIPNTVPSDVTEVNVNGQAIVPIGLEETLPLTRLCPLNISYVPFYKKINLSINYPKDKNKKVEKEAVLRFSILFEPKVKKVEMGKDFNARFWCEGDAINLGDKKLLLNVTFYEDKEYLFDLEKLVSFKILDYGLIPTTSPFDQIIGLVRDKKFDINSSKVKINSSFEFIAMDQEAEKGFNFSYFSHDQYIDFYGNNKGNLTFVLDFGPQPLFCNNNEILETLNYLLESKIIVVQPTFLS